MYFNIISYLCGNQQITGHVIYNLYISCNWLFSCHGRRHVLQCSKWRWSVRWCYLYAQTERAPKCAEKTAKPAYVQTIDQLFPATMKITRKLVNLEGTISWQSSSMARKKCPIFPANVMTLKTTYLIFFPNTVGDVPFADGCILSAYLDSSISFSSSRSISLLHRHPFFGKIFMKKKKMK